MGGSPPERREWHRIGVCRDDDPDLLESSRQDFLIACRVHSVRPDVHRVITCRHQQVRQARRQGIVDQNFKQIAEAAVHGP